ncbi:hypothetical protein BD410DRAFT_809515 [Rickenella mellea]|uniref:Uncharacterized protein n=1 Tax=Rickenella mellea TaxID=50990 RepID=A0A4Y7PI95_9AGAM|nr:hypothetical protein BD410DRAFT_809515 [Rickenella mellea]
MSAAILPSHDSPTPSEGDVELCSPNGTYTKELQIKAEEDNIKMEDESVKAEEESIKCEYDDDDDEHSEYDDDTEEEMDTSEDEYSEYVPDEDEVTYSDNEDMMNENMLPGDYEVIRGRHRPSIYPSGEPISLVNFRYLSLFFLKRVFDATLHWRPTDVNRGESCKVVGKSLMVMRTLRVCEDAVPELEGVKEFVMDSPHTREKTLVWLRRVRAKRQLYRARRAASAALDAAKRMEANPVRAKAQIDSTKLEGVGRSELRVAAVGSKAASETQSSPKIDPQTPPVELPSPSPHRDTDVHGFHPITPEQNTPSDDQYLKEWSTPSPSTIACRLAEAHGQAEAAAWGHIFRTSNGSPIHYWPYQDIYIWRSSERQHWHDARLSESVRCTSQENRKLDPLGVFGVVVRVVRNSFPVEMFSMDQPLENYIRPKPMMGAKLIVSCCAIFSSVVQRKIPDASWTVPDAEGYLAQRPIFQHWITIFNRLTIRVMAFFW